MIRIAILIAFLFLAQIMEVRAFPIDDIKVEGVPIDQIESVRTLSGILPGDEFDESRVERAKTRIHEVYAAKGYPEVEVQTSTAVKGEQRRLLIELKLGKPLKISSVVFTSKDPIAPDFLLKLKQVVDLRPGELFDRDRIKEMRRAVEVAIVSQDFVDSRVSDITTSVEKDGLQLQFALELGQKVVLSVQGNQYYSRAELMSLIEKQRLLGLGRDYVGVITNQLHDFYVDLGFKQIKISEYSFEPHGNEAKKVVFDIDEGPRVRLRKIIVDGNETYSDSDWEDFFYKNASDRLRARIYNAKMVDDAAKAMIDELRKKGFLSAKLIAMKTEEVEEGRAIDLRFFVSEGVQTHVQRIEFNGNQTFTAEELAKFLGLKPGDPLSLVLLEDGLERIKKEYRNRGYLNLMIVNESSGQLVSYSEKNQFADLSISLAEGNIVRLEGFEIFGNEATRRAVIERELQIKIGEPIAEDKVLETDARLKRLGIFSQTTLDFKDSTTNPDSKVMKVSVQEVDRGNSNIGFGFRNDLGVRIFSGLSYANLWGMNHTWAFNASGNRRLGDDYRFNEFSAQMSYTWPWAFLGDTTFRPSLLAERKEFPIAKFDAETFSFSASLDRMLIRSKKLSGGLTYTFEKVREFNAPLSINNQQYLIGSITPQLRIDLRDNPLVPRRGIYALTSFEFANAALGSQTDPIPVSYGRYQFRGDFYTDFIPKIVWYTSIRGGWLKNLANPAMADGSKDPRISAPIIKQFALGGVNSIRGFSEQELNVQAQNQALTVTGYSTYVNYRTQMDFFVAPSLSFGSFLDAGNLQVDAFSMGTLRYGTGASMRYITPVGPVNFDWGFKLFPRPGETTNVFYFSLGVI